MSEPTNNEVRATAILVDLYPDYAADPETGSVAKVAEALDKAEAREHEETIKDCIAALEAQHLDLGPGSLYTIGILRCVKVINDLLDTKTKSEKKQ